MEENKEKLKPKIQKNIIDKLIFQPDSFDFRNELKIQDKSSYNPYLELNYNSKTEIGCFFKKQQKKNSTLGLKSVKKFKLGEFYVMPENDELHVREYEFDGENRVAVRYHYALRTGPETTDDKEMDIFVAIDWAKDGKTKILRFDIFFIMKTDGDSLLKKEYTPIVIGFANHMMGILSNKTACDDCIHRFAYQMNNECSKVYEKELAIK